MGQVNGHQWLSAAAVPVACLAVLFCALAGCSSSAQTRAELVKSLDDAASAVQTSALTLDLLQQRRVSRAVAATSLEEQSQQLASIEQSLAESAAADPGSDADRRRTSELVGAGSDEVATARMLLDQQPASVPGSGALHSSGDALQALAGQVESRR